MRVGRFHGLPGLAAHYLARQMDDYASGACSNAVITPIAQQLSPVDRQSVALYYAGLPLQVPRLGLTPEQARHIAAYLYTLE